jgi:enamine deaminase RidA (YjgF/YER057c/UK114 family)
MPLEYLGAPPLASDRQVRPFSPAVRAGDFVYVSGQVPVNKEGEIVTGGIEAQTRQVMENLKTVLALAGATLDDVCKSTVWCRTRATLVPSTAST